MTKPIPTNTGVGRNQQSLADLAGGAICGGLVKESEYKEATKEDVWAYAMAWVIPDDWYTVYAAVKQLGDHDLAHKIADKYSWSVI